MAATYTLIQVEKGRVNPKTQKIEMQAICTICPTDEVTEVKAKLMQYTKVNSAETVLIGDKTELRDLRDRCNALLWEF